MKVFICGEDVSSIFSAVYDAGRCGFSRTQVRIEPEGCEPELFCEYTEVESADEKMLSVSRSIREKVSEEVYESVYKAALSQEKYRADAIYRFLFEAFRYGRRVMDMLSVPEVYRIFDMNRNLRFEYDHMRGFTRFSETEEGILVGKIAPKNDLTVLLAAFFSDRLPEDNWVLYDINRKKAAVHQKGVGWAMVQTDGEEWQRLLTQATDEADYRRLWRTFHESIGIADRKNPRCQRTMLPLRFRPYMTEFQND